MKPTAGVGAAERQVADGARAHDPGDGGKLARQVLAESLPLWWAVGVDLRQRHLHGEHALRIEPGVDVQERGQATNHQPGAAEDDDRQGDFDGHERAARAGGQPRDAAVAVAK